ncbi:alanine racemase [Catellatospora bangladeshensis]|uniref:Alanine racemase n=1 Tax=Catellatospora bangladeshensis TaxID=310355 RepID=A0A8J3J709_9ACTN|nr:alanine racemase [Catellatospora bangladeshensis]GIF79307.1 alanine racemase [Catellatospora bangladeshensis]
MWQGDAQSQVVVDLDAIRANVATLRSHTTAQVMAVVKGDGYGHGMVPAARAALSGGATWLGVCTLEEAFGLRDAGLTAPVLSWLWLPGQPVGRAIERDVDLSVASLSQLAAVLAGAREAGRAARLHLKIDTGLSRGGATAQEWPQLVEAAAKAQADGYAEIVGVWSHFVYADAPGHETIDLQLAGFTDALGVALRLGVEPQLRHIANSAATLTRPDTHFDLVRPGIAVYGLSPVEDPAIRASLRPAMTARARVLLAKRLPAGQGISYGHTYVTERESTVALVPLGYADGVPRHASNSGPVLLNGARYTVAGRVCMDQFVVDAGDAPVAEGDEVILFGPGDRGEPTADDWAEAVGTINYEIVTRFGSSRVPRVYRGDDA